MDVTILLYDQMTALDAIGPYDVLGHVPGVHVRFAAHHAGPIAADTGTLKLVATHSLAAISATDLLLVPGGNGTRRLIGDQELLGWLRALDAHTTTTVSVCTGSLLLAAAGLLEGRRATSHWAVRDDLALWGAIPTPSRIVRDGKYATCAGVSAGIDLGLALLAEHFGESTAKTVQLAIEYDPEPPFDCGSPERAPADLVARVRALMPPVKQAD